MANGDVVNLTGIGSLIKAFDTQTTSDSYISSSSVSLRMDGSALIWVKNSGAINDLFYKIQATVDGTNWETIKNQTVLPASTSYYDTVSDPWYQIRIQGSSTTAGSTTTIDANVITGPMSVGGTLNKTHDIHTGSLVTIDEEHERIHDADHYFCSDHATSINTASPMQWSLTVPNNNLKIHFVYRTNVTGAGLFELSEDTTVASTHTALTIYNNDRNSSNIGTMLAYKNTVVSAQGTLLSFNHVGGAGSNLRSGAATDRNEEIILKTNSKYLLKFTPDTNGVAVSVHFSWYEHDGGV